MSSTSPYPWPDGSKVARPFAAPTSDTYHRHMKLAHSNLLGEYVSASEVAHADTAGFQIVCPCCAESVFKVARTLGDGRLSEFFSHRQAPPVQVAECELRVGGIASEDLAARNASARGQSLALFRQWMRSALGLDRWCYGHRSPADVHARLSGMEIGSRAFDQFRRDQVRLGADDVLSDELPMVRKGLEGMGVPIVTTFERSVQDRIVGDMLRHLLTEEGRANHAYLFRYTVLRMHVVDRMLRERIREGASGTKALPADVGLMLQACVTRNPRMAQALVDEADRRFDPADTDRFYRMVTMAMMTDLCRIPYAEMLANHRAGRPPLDGVPVRREPDALGGIRVRLSADPAPAP
jgi:hypothetical protein